MDPRLRDYVFIPLVILMVGMQLIRITVMRYMNEPKNPLLDEIKLAFNTLVGTAFELDCNREKKVDQEQKDIVMILDEGTDTNKKRRPSTYKKPTHAQNG